MVHGAPDYNQSVVAGGGATVIQPQRPFFNREASQMSLGEVVINDNGVTLKGCKYTTVANNRHAAGVVGSLTVDPGVEGNLFYHGAALINVTGSGAAGAALVTSTVAGRAKASGRSKTQYGFIGYAYEAWSGNSQILAFLDVAEDFYGANVRVEGGEVFITGGAGGSRTVTGTVVTGNNPDRLVLMFTAGRMGSGAGATTGAIAIVGGVNATQLGAEVTAWTEAGSATLDKWRCYYFIDPPVGSVLCSSGAWSFSDATSNTVALLAIALSGVNQATPLRTLVTTNPTTSTPFLACSDAVPGDLVIAQLLNGNAADRGYLVTGYPAAQTEQDRTNLTGVNADMQGYLHYLDAQSQTQQASYTLSASLKTLLAQVPVIPA